MKRCELSLKESSEGEKVGTKEQARNDAKRSEKRQKSKKRGKHAKEKKQQVELKRKT